MIADLLKSINWVDIVMLLLAVRIIYVAAHTGFVMELFKFLGVLVTLFVCFHYYTGLGATALKALHLPSGIFQATAFLILWLVTSLLCILARYGLGLLFTVEAHSTLDRWGAGLLGVVHFFVVASMVLFVFIASGHKYLQTKTSSSFSHRYVLYVAPTIYKKACDNIVSRLFPTERYNKAVEVTLRGPGK